MKISSSNSAAEYVAFSYGKNQNEAYYQRKLGQLRSKIKEFKTAMATFSKNTPEAAKIQDKLDLARAKYLKLLNELNTLRSNKKRSEIKANSKGLKKIEMFERKSVIEYQREMIRNESANSPQFTYNDDVSNKYIQNADLNYKINILDTVIF